MTFGRKPSMRECRRVRGVTSRRCRFDAPPSRQQPEHFRPGESIVDQMQDAAVRQGPDHAAGGLHHLSDAGEKVSVVVARTKLGVEPSSQFFVDRIELGQSERCDEGSDQPRSGQVDAFCKGTAEHGETNPATIQCEPRQKGFAIGLVHAPALLPCRDARVPRAKLAHRLFEVVEAAEKR